jgi:hypothetical protein
MEEESDGANRFLAATGSVARAILTAYAGGQRTPLLSVRNDKANPQPILCRYLS